MPSSPAESAVELVQSSPQNTSVPQRSTSPLFRLPPSPQLHISYSLLCQDFTTFSFSCLFCLNQLTYDLQFWQKQVHFPGLSTSSCSPSPRRNNPRLVASLASFSGHPSSRRPPSSSKATCNHPSRFVSVAGTRQSTSRVDHLPAASPQSPCKLESHKQQHHNHNCIVNNVSTR